MILDVVVSLNSDGTVEASCRFDGEGFRVRLPASPENIVRICAVAEALLVGAKFEDDFAAELASARDGTESGD